MQRDRFFTPAWIFWLAPALLMLILLWFFSGQSAYTPVSENLLAEPVSQTLKAKQIEAENTHAWIDSEGVLITRASDGFQGQHSFYLDGFGSGQSIRLLAEYAASGLTNNRADIRLVLRDEAGKPMSAGTTGIVYGSRDWRKLEMVLHPRSKASHGLVRIQNYSSSGEYRVRNLSLTEVEENSFGRYGLWVAFSFLSILLLWYGVGLGVFRSLSGTIVLICSASVFMATLWPSSAVTGVTKFMPALASDTVELRGAPAQKQPEDSKPVLVQLAVKALGPVLDRERWPSEYKDLERRLSVLGHTLLFAAFAFILSAYSMTRMEQAIKAYLITVLALLLFGAVAEWVQIFSQDRNANFEDMWLNYLGSMIGIIFYLLYSLIKHFLMDVFCRLRGS